MEKQDLSTWIEGIEYRTRVSVDLFDDDAVWINVIHGFGNTHITINKKAAKEMIEALTRIVDEMESP
jgi:hydrogenase maturation factor